MSREIEQKFRHGSLFKPRANHNQTRIIIGFEPCPFQYKFRLRRTPHQVADDKPLIRIHSSCVEFSGLFQRLKKPGRASIDRMIAVQNDHQEFSLASRDARARRVLNAGCGPKSIRKLDAMFEPTGWREIRMDLDAAVEPDVIGSMTDLRTHFGARSFDAIWSSHSLEHLHSHEIPIALTEFQRILKPDGFALITCPDLETVMTLFLRHGPDHVVYQSAAGPITPLDMMFGHSPSIARGAVHMAHHSGLTSERLGELLLQAGFAEAITKRQGYDLWALALMEHADRDAIRRRLGAAGVDMTDDPE